MSTPAAAEATSSPQKAPAGGGRTGTVQKSPQKSTGRGAGARGRGLSRVPAAVSPAEAQGGPGKSTKEVDAKGPSGYTISVASPTAAVSTEAAADSAAGDTAGCEAAQAAVPGTGGSALGNDWPAQNSSASSVAAPWPRPRLSACSGASPPRRSSTCSVGTRASSAASAISASSSVGKTTRRSSISIGSLSTKDRRTSVSTAATSNSAASVNDSAGLAEAFVQMSKARRDVRRAGLGRNRAVADKDPHAGEPVLATGPEQGRPSLNSEEGLSVSFGLLGRWLAGDETELEVHNVYDDDDVQGHDFLEDRIAEWQAVGAVARRGSRGSKGRRQGLKHQPLCATNSADASDAALQHLERIQRFSERIQHLQQQVQEEGDEGSEQLRPTRRSGAVSPLRLTAAARAASVWRQIADRSPFRRSSQSQGSPSEMARPSLPDPPQETKFANTGRASLFSRLLCAEKANEHVMIDFR